MKKKEAAPEAHDGLGEAPGGTNWEANVNSDEEVIPVKKVR